MYIYRKEEPTKRINTAERTQYITKERKAYRNTEQTNGIFNERKTDRQPN